MWNFQERPLRGFLILGEARNILEGGGKNGKRPALWDGRAAERIVEKLRDLL